MWRLETMKDTGKTGALPRSIENVHAPSGLDCNAVAMDLRTGLVLDGGGQAIRQRKVDFVYQTIRHSEETFAAKR